MEKHCLKRPKNTKQGKTTPRACYDPHLADPALEASAASPVESLHLTCRPYGMSLFLRLLQSQTGLWRQDTDFLETTTVSFTKVIEFGCFVGNSISALREEVVVLTRASQLGVQMRQHLSMPQPMLSVPIQPPRGGFLTAQNTLLNMPVRF